MTQRIAPNNQLPATHFIEVWTDGETTNQQNIIEMEDDAIETPNLIALLSTNLHQTAVTPSLYTIAIFRIRENKLTTKHKFNK